MNFTIFEEIEKNVQAEYDKATQLSKDYIEELKKSCLPDTIKNIMDYEQDRRHLKVSRYLTKGLKESFFEVPPHLREAARSYIKNKEILEKNMEGRWIVCGNAEGSSDGGMLKPAVSGKIVIDESLPILEMNLKKILGVEF